MRPLLPLLSVLLLTTSALAQRIEVTVPSKTPLNGHLILVLSKKDTPEPRMLLEETYESQQAFGVDSVNADPTKPLVINSTTIGYPRASLSDIDPGDYTVQAVF